MTLIRSVLGAVFAFTLAASVGAEECAFGEVDGERGSTFKDLPYYWVFNVLADKARAYGVAKVYGLSDGSAANTIFEIDRSDSAARKGRTYRSFVEINYWPKALPPRALKAKLDIGGASTEFTVQEIAKDSSRPRPALSGPDRRDPQWRTGAPNDPRRGQEVHRAVLHGCVDEKKV
jgi:hypothetical protein